jgi:hypothetical protein
MGPSLEQDEAKQGAQNQKYQDQNLTPHAKVAMAERGSPGHHQGGKHLKLSGD